MSILSWMHSWLRWIAHAWLRSIHPRSRIRLMRHLQSRIVLVRHSRSRILLMTMLRTSRHWLALGFISFFSSRRYILPYHQWGGGGVARILFGADVPFYSGVAIPSAAQRATAEGRRRKEDDDDDDASFSSGVAIPSAAQRARAEG